MRLYCTAHISFRTFWCRCELVQGNCCGYGDETISDSVQHQDPAASSSLLECIQLQLLQHGCQPVTLCPSVISTGKTCSVPLNLFDFVDVDVDAMLST